MTPKIEFCPKYVRKLEAKLETLQAERLELIAELRRLGEDKCPTKIAQRPTDSADEHQNHRAWAETGWGAASNLQAALMLPPGKWEHRGEGVIALRRTSSQLVVKMSTS